MKALFIGQSYIDITFLADEMPTGDEKTVARDYAVSFGGNAVTAAFCCAKLGIAPDLLASVADDWLGRMFIDMAAKYGISVHHRKVAESSLSFIMPKGGQRAIVRCRDDHFKHPFPHLNLDRLPRAACRRASARCRDPLRQESAARPAFLRRSMAAGCARTRTICWRSSKSRWSRNGLCEQMKLSARRDADLSALARLQDRRRHARARGACSGTTRAKSERFLPALNVPDDLVIDTNGAGDIFHGAYVYSYLTDPDRDVGAAFQVRPRRIGLFDPASRQRGEPADARPDQRDASAVRRAPPDAASA